MRSQPPAVRDGFAQTYTFGLLYEREPVVDAGALVARLGDHVPTEVVSSSEAVVQLALRTDGLSSQNGLIPTFINAVRWYRPLKTADFTSALQQTFDWPDAQSVVHRCQYKLLLGDLNGARLPYKERYDLMSAVVIAVAEVTKPAAIHWEVAGCFISPERLARRLGWKCNVRAHDIVPRKGDKLMDTLGLAALGLVDAQCLSRELEPIQMALWMYAIGKKLFNDGDVIQDGAGVLGPIAGEQWLCHHTEATIPPRRPVIDIKPSVKHAGKL